jgi:RHS repeat-associated protein
VVLTISYAYDPQGTLVQRIISDDLFPTDCGVFDAFGSPRGKMAWDEDHGVPPDPLREPVGFAGQGCYTDQESGLVLMGHRYYDPARGRFITRDPIGYAAGMNLYTYCDGDPVNRIDPLGLDWLDTLSNFCAGAGDSLTFGLTSFARSGINKIVWDETSDMVDHDGTAYVVGAWTETGVELAVTFGSSSLKKLASRKMDDLARREMGTQVRQIFGQQRKENLVHHTNPLNGHPVNLTGGKPVPTVFPMRGLPGKVHSGRWNLKLYPNTPAGRAAHMAAHQKLMKLERGYRAVVNPVTTGTRVIRNTVNQSGVTSTPGYYNNRREP